MKKAEESYERNMTETSDDSLITKRMKDIFLKVLKSQTNVHSSIRYPIVTSFLYQSKILPFLAGVCQKAVANRKSDTICACLECIQLAINNVREVDDASKNS